MDQAEDRNYQSAYRIQHLQHLLAMPVSSDEGIKNHWKEANDIKARYVDRLFPWLEKTLTKNSGLDNAVSSMTSQWEEIWGDMQDPKTQRKIWQTVKAMDPNAEIPAEYR